MKPVDEQMAILMRGVDFGDEQIRETMERELRERLSEGRPLRVYCGYDPTAPDLHLGHTVTMRKLRQFQELGHEVVFLIGTGTGLIGDPSDRDSARPRRTREELHALAKTYTDQVWKILDRQKTIVRYNDEWLTKLTLEDIIKLASNFTVQQFLVRDNFSKRYAKGDPIWLHELLYALMQGYDAVALRTDVQIGGTDQLFNLIAGRKIMEFFGLRPQICLTFPILVGTDGYLRMSKSTGNYIGIDEPPEQMYGKVMSLPDHAMSNYFNLVTRWTPAEIAHIEAELKSGKLHPRDAKMKLAWEIVSIFHGDAAADAAEAHFRTVFQERELPPDMPTFTVAGSANVVDLMVEAGLAKSKSAARRLIQQGGVQLDGRRVEDINTVVEVADEAVLQVGRRRFVKLIAG
ncbi:MAG: tyrosine--tRNA ligase [Anaerolineae bacterium]|jgi:tyrosyl-tRNA synthetase|nr:tyrosine--tRNA ligase [Anaerolineae bacterium]MDH7473963.1 tyrosine--tRNA ligase [Anaerolineae bacterium]